MYGNIHTRYGLIWYNTSILGSWNSNWIQLESRANPGRLYNLCNLLTQGSTWVWLGFSIAYRNLYTRYMLWSFEIVNQDGGLVDGHASKSFPIPGYLDLPSTRKDRGFPHTAVVSNCYNSSKPTTSNLRNEKADSCLFFATQKKYLVN